jgi:hypothetical protein
MRGRGEGHEGMMPRGGRLDKGRRGRRKREDETADRVGRRREEVGTRERLRERRRIEEGRQRGRGRIRREKQGI